MDYSLTLIVFIEFSAVMTYGAKKDLKNIWKYFKICKKVKVGK